MRRTTTEEIAHAVDYDQTDLRPFPWSRKRHGHFSPKWQQKALHTLLLLRRLQLPNDINDLVLQYLAPRAITPSHYAYLQKRPLPSPHFWPAVNVRIQHELPWQGRVLIAQWEDNKPAPLIRTGFVATMMESHGKQWVEEMLYLLWNIYAVYHPLMAQKCTSLINLL